MKLRISEVAHLANVTKRTVDYYTNKGLLQAERSPSNYRYYTEDAVERIQFIESLKKEKLSLEQIAERLKQDEPHEENLDGLKAKIKELECDVEEIASILKANGFTKEMIKKNLSPESISLMQALLLFLC
ncbi:MerR family transcriptional regulator [Peribacillus kribbensis]|uniref:MerR family transcriptional regulator n=1 Tax=Peribacillus kribbensis TaxID=356658 RepID=UPI000402780B|nr:MerR family transcriptional regulator [Peribacillus kribbensis]